MNRIPILGAASLLLTACHTQPQSNPEGIVLNVELAGLADSTPVTISLAATQQPEDPLQTITLIDGKGQFAFDVEGPRIYSIQVADSYGLMKVALDRGNVATLKATAQRETSNTGGGQTKPLYQYADECVTGTSLQEEYLRRSVDREALNVLYDAYHQIEDPEEMAAAEKRFFQVVDSTFKATIAASADTWWGPAILMDSYSYLSEEQKKEYEQFSPAAKASFYGELLKENLWPSELEGREMPDFTFTNHADSRQVSLREVLEKSRYVLIDFWASWCKPCRKEIPNIKQLYDQYHAEGFDVVSISADDDEAAWLKALDEEQLPWYNDRDGKQGLCNLYKVSYYPTLYLLDSEGKVVAKDVRGEELQAKMREIFEK